MVNQVGTMKTWSALMAAALAAVSALAPTTAANGGTPGCAEGLGVSDAWDLLNRTANASTNGTEDMPTGCLVDVSPLTGASRPCYLVEIVSYRPDPSSLHPVLGMVVIDPDHCITPILDRSISAADDVSLIGP